MPLYELTDLHDYLMKILILTIASVFLATAMGFNSEKLITYRDVEVKEHKQVLETYKEVELTPLEHKPLYCSDYLKSYSWNQEVAYNVMMIESGNKARNLNDNPGTGDYSVGCFQINLLGSNQTAKYNLAVSLGYTGANERYELREWLWNPKNNVALAYKM